MTNIFELRMAKSMYFLWSVEQWLHFKEFWEVSVVVVKKLRRHVEFAFKFFDKMANKRVTLKIINLYLMPKKNCRSWLLFLCSKFDIISESDLISLLSLYLVTNEITLRPFHVTVRSVRLNNTNETAEFQSFQIPIRCKSALKLGLKYFKHFKRL